MSNGNLAAAADAIKQANRRRGNVAGEDSDYEPPMATMSRALVNGGNKVLLDVSAADSVADVLTELGGVTSAHVDSAIQAAQIGFESLKGTLDCSTNPDYPAAAKGDGWKITVDGLIGGDSGQPVKAGDLAVALEDNPGGAQGDVGSSWFVLQGDLVAGVDYLTPSGDLSSTSGTNGDMQALVNSAMADPTSNGNWSQSNWFLDLDVTQPANVGIPTDPASRTYTLTGPQWRRWCLVDPNFTEVNVNWREFPRGITYYTQLATDPAPAASEEGLVCTGRYSVYYKFNTGQMMPMKSLGWRFAETPTASGTYCTIGAQLVKDSSNYVGVLYDAVAQEVQIAGQLGGVFHKYVGFSVPVTSITPGTEVWMTVYQNDICAFIRYGTTGNYRFLGSAYTAETGRDLSLPATADAYTYGMLYASDGASSRIVVDKTEGGLGGGCGMREIRFIKDLTGKPVMSGDDYWISFDVPFWYDTNKFSGVDANQTLGIPACYLAIGLYKPGARSVKMTRIIFAERACNDSVVRRLGNQDARVYLIDPTRDHWRIVTSGFDDYNFANNASQFYSYQQDYYGPLLEGPVLKLTGLTSFSFGADHALYDLDVLQYGSYYWIVADLLGQSHPRVYRATLPDLSDATYFGTDASLTSEGCELERVGNELYLYMPNSVGAYTYRLDNAASGDLFPARTGQITLAPGTDGSSPVPHHTIAQQQQGDGVHERSLRLTFTTDYVHGMIWTYGQTSERVSGWWTGEQYGRSRQDSR